MIDFYLTKEMDGMNVNFTVPEDQSFKTFVTRHEASIDLAEAALFRDEEIESVTLTFDPK